MTEPLDRRQLVTPLLITTVLVAFYLAAGWYFIQNDERRWLENRYAEMGIELRNQAADIERQLNRALVASESMESYIRHHNGQVEDFDDHSADLIRNVGIIEVLELAPAGVVSHLFPLEGYESLLGRRVAEEGPGAFEARQAIVTRESTLSQTYTLEDGTQVIIGRSPVYIGTGHDEGHDHAADTGAEHFEYFWGFASVIIKVEDLLNETQLHRLTEHGYRYQLTGGTDGERSALIAGSDVPLSPERSVETSIRVARGGMVLRIEPIEPLQNSPMYMLHLGLFTTIGMLVAVFIFTMLWLPIGLRAQIATKSRDLMVANERYQSVFDSVREVIFQIDSRHKWKLLNPAWEDITGYQVIESLGREAATFFNVDDALKFRALLDESLAGRHVGMAELRLRGRDGEERWIELSLRADRHGDDISGSMSDITERKRSDRLIRYQANYDTLTSLPNRKLFRDRFAQAIEFTERNGTRLALMFLDLDRFKWINDTLGHAAGDKLLIEVSKRLRSCVRKVDTVGRFGGDEFILLIAEISHSLDAEIVARKVLEELARPIILDGSEETITCSIGITICPDDGSDITTLMSNADNVMYLAKESGRNNFKFYTDEMNKALVERRSKEDALRRAIDSHALQLHFQPIYRFPERRPVAVEALLRWDSEEFGRMPTNEIIALAENTRMIDTLGEWVLRESSICFNRLLEAGLRLQYFNVNFSPRQFRGSGLEQIEDLIDQGIIKPDQLAIDITEELVAFDQKSIWDALDKLKRHGVRVILDDFGSGLSSLSYLNHLSPEAIKISGEYLSGIVPDTGAAAMIGSIIAMAHSVGIDVISEAVGDSRQVEMMEVLGCDYAQGNHLCEPLSVEDLIERLKNA